MNQSRHHRHGVRDTEVIHVALDTYLSACGDSSGGVWLWGNRRGFGRSRQNFVLSLFDPFCGLSARRPFSESLKETSQRKAELGKFEESSHKAVFCAFKIHSCQKESDGDRKTLTIWRDYK
jgi:hypothetical protein